MYIHAFDPGESTGFCILEVPVLKVIYTSVFTDYQDFNNWRTGDTVAWTPKMVVIEAFRLYAYKAQSQIGSYFPSAEKAGIVKYICWLDRMPWVEQMASCKKAFERPQVVQQVLPGYVLPESEHEKDALRHALYYWFNTGRHR